MFDSIKACNRNLPIQSRAVCLFSNLSKNINKIAFPVIILVGMYMSKVNAGSCSASDYNDCLDWCAEASVLYEDPFHEFEACANVCIKYFSYS